MLLSHACLSNKIEEIQTIFQTVESLQETLSVSPKTIFQLKLVIEEIFTNIISYGYDNNRPNLVDLKISFENERLGVEIVDDGRPFNPIEEAPEPDLTASLEAKRVGGLGIHLLFTLMEDPAYHRIDGRNHLVFYKTLEKEPSA